MKSFSYLHIICTLKIIIIMTPTTKKFRPMRKIRVPDGLISALNDDRKREHQDMIMSHVAAVGIAYRSYKQIIDTQMARPDVIEKVQNYFKNR